MMLDDKEEEKKTKWERVEAEEAIVVSRRDQRNWPKII